MALHIVQSVLFSALMFCAGYKDIKTGRIPNSLSLLILLTAFLNFPKLRPVDSVLGLLLLPLPCLVGCLHDKIGGGDVKLVAACGFLLGFNRGIAALLASLLLAAVFQTIYRKAKGLPLSSPFPLAPYLCAGYVSIFWLL